ncbi:hypothetical protein PAXRUDRAFT_9334 [Paxillus rubicundulus Ve08.2h10]|uniref:Uncharacterized protein n=1 Tax=Paxillus rubicundulus Ve08.2h10 TaxID=930991 RepID=A0A0D0E3H1_9AGAM|nr:hypothetical protein PAXRUDRAFT_9334 [Paxillus rubicundulus Ve08.2h10]
MSQPMLGSPDPDLQVPVSVFHEVDAKIDDMISETLQHSPALDFTFINEYGPARELLKQQEPPGMLRHFLTSLNSVSRLFLFLFP